MPGLELAPVRNLDAPVRSKARLIIKAVLKGKEIRSGQDRYSVLGARPFPCPSSDNTFQAQPFTFIQMAGTRNVVSELRQVFIFLLLVPILWPSACVLSTHKIVAPVKKKNEFII